MSNLSKWLKSKLGIPEVKLQSSNDVVAQLARQVAEGRVGEIARLLPDAVFASVWSVLKAEAVRRGVE